MRHLLQLSIDLEIKLIVSIFLLFQNSTATNNPAINPIMQGDYLKNIKL